MAVPLDELGHGAALHAHAGPDQGHLVRQVQQAPGTQPLPHLELRRRLEQEDALGAARVDHVVHRRVLGVDAADVGTKALPRLDEVQRLLDLVEHRQREQVDLGEARVGHAVLVPVHDVAAVDGPSAHRRHRGDGRVAEDHAADVLPEAARGVHELWPQRQQVTPARRVHALAIGGQRQHLAPQVDGVVGAELLG